jgi:signal peptidase I
MEDLEAIVAGVVRTGTLLRFRARGTSMLPTIRDGDVVYIAPVTRPAIRIGDIVFCRHDGGRVVAHRVIKIARGKSGPALVTKGDFTQAADPPVQRENVIGRVVAVERAGCQVALDTPLRRVSGLLCAHLVPLARRIRRGLA